MEQTENNLNSVSDSSGFKDKVLAHISRVKRFCINLFMSLIAMFGKIISNKKLLFITIAILIVILVAGGLSYYFLRGDEGEQSIFSIFKKGELVATGTGVGQTVWLGNLRVTLFDVRDGSYRPLELDDRGQRVTRGYFGADIEVYNSDLNTTDFLIYGLTDDLGNEYERDFDIDFYLDDIQDLGVAKNYIPQTLRRGFLFFPPINEGAKKLELTVFSEVQNKKIIFEIPR